MKRTLSIASLLTACLLVPAALAQTAADSTGAWPNFGPLTPKFDAVSLAWIAFVLILTLKWQTRPLRSWHNLDALVLAATCLLLPLRNVRDAVPGDPTNLHFEGWSIALLTAAGVYWLLRGIALLLSGDVKPIQANVSEGSLTVLVVAALAVACWSIVTAPISDASRDGLVGGLCLAETGHLPYGDAPGHDARSPLLYAVHAGVVKLVPPTVDVAGERGDMSWGNRAKWIDKPWQLTVDPSPIRLVNAALFLLTFAAIAGIGHRQHSIALGQSIAAVFCLFPGTLECVAQPDIMLPTMLLTWSLACLRVPAVGGLLSAVCAVLAGVAWPWAWLALPVLLGYWLRTGWNGLGSVVGLVASIGGVAYALAMHVAPSLPRADGALAAAGMPPKYVATESEGRLSFAPYDAPASAPGADLRAPLWRFLLQGDTAKLYREDGVPLAGEPTEPLSYRELAATPAARPLLQSGYRKSIAGLAPETRLWPALRTVLECTWKPETAPASATTQVWTRWFGSGHDADTTVLWARRAAKALAGLIALLAFWTLVRAPAARPHQALGGLLAVSAAVLLASENGATANWVWLAPAALGAIAATSELVPRENAAEAAASAARISVNT